MNSLHAESLTARLVSCSVLYMATLGFSSEPSTSFTNKPFVHPKLVEELVSAPFEKSGSDQVVAVDLFGSRGANRYCCEEYAVVDDPGRGAYVSYEKWEDGRHHSFGYQFVGQSDSGIVVLHARESDGGSGVWHQLLFLTIVEDHGLEVSPDGKSLNLTKHRSLVKKLGCHFLDDRWKGFLKVEGNSLFIGENQGWFSENVSDEYPPKDFLGWATILTLPSDLRQPNGGD